MVKTLGRRWNLFARELEDVLDARGLGLGVIDDRTLIHQEKVRRLQLSLRSPKHFPLLNPDDLELVIATFTLTADEVIRLRAAVVATSVEATLMGRITPDDALRAAEQVFDIVLGALRGQELSLGSIRGDTGHPASVAPEVDSDDRWPELQPALAALDHGTAACYLARDDPDYSSRVGFLQQACLAFEVALRELGQTVNTVDAGVWQVWHDEARRGLRLSQAEIEDNELGM